MSPIRPVSEPVSKEDATSFGNGRVHFALETVTPSDGWKNVYGGAFPGFNECVAIPKVEWWSYRNSHMLGDVIV